MKIFIAVSKGSFTLPLNKCGENLLSPQCTTEHVIKNKHHCFQGESFFHLVSVLEMGKESTFQELKKTVGFFEVCFHSSNIKTMCKSVANKKLLWKSPEPKGDLKKPTFSKNKTTQSSPLITLASCPRRVWSCTKLPGDLSQYTRCHPETEEGR